MMTTGNNSEWNAAIDAAASYLAQSYPDNVNTNAFCAALENVRGG